MSVPALLKALTATLTPGWGIRWESYCWSSASLVSILFHGSNKQALKDWRSSPGHGTSTLGLTQTEQTPPSPRDHRWDAVDRLLPLRWTKTPSRPPHYKIQKWNSLHWKRIPSWRYEHFKNTLSMQISCQSTGITRWKSWNWPQQINSSHVKLKICTNIRLIYGHMFIKVTDMNKKKKGLLKGVSAKVINFL